ENRARIDICFPNVLSNDQRDDLERMVRNEEVKKAVWDCGSDKSPGPDGFSFSFFAIFGQRLKKIFLRINMCKSKIMGVNVKDGKIQNAASKLGCLVLKTPFTYLGTKVGKNMSRKEA
nr:RNA-directed DNA polymerase, eukaryota [Tanacetum cinerariifolium]